MSKISTKIYVGGLPETCRRQELQALFEEYGKVVECDIVRNYAFVHFDNPDQAKMAVEALDNTDFQGTTISVQLSHSKVRHQPGMGNRDGCFKCGKPGHWSKDCHLSGGRGSRGGDRGGDRRGDRRMGDPYGDYPSSFGRERSGRGSHDMSPYAEMYERKMAERRLILMREMQRLNAASRDPYARPPPDYYRRAGGASLAGRDPIMDLQRRLPGNPGDRYQRGNY